MISSELCRLKLTLTFSIPSISIRMNRNRRQCQGESLSPSLIANLREKVIVLSGKTRSTPSIKTTQRIKIKYVIKICTNIFVHANVDIDSKVKIGNCRHHSPSDESRTALILTGSYIFEKNLIRVIFVLNYLKQVMRFIVCYMK